MSSPSAPPATLTIADTAALVTPPDALEEVAGSAVPLIVTSLGNDLGIGDVDVDRLVDRLGVVRAVTVGIVRDRIGLQLERLAAAYDVLLAAPDQESLAAVPVADTAEAVAALAESVATNPQAAVALAQLLRFGLWDDVASALAAESFVYSTLQAGPEFARWLGARGPAVVPDDAEPPVLVERHDDRLEIVLNRPARANAITAAVRDLLVEALRLAATDPSIEAVVVRGAGRSFCSGGDLAEFGSAPDPATAHLVRTLRSPAWWFHQVGRRVRVHLHGACMGGGIELASFAGTVLAAPDTLIRLPEVAMGLIPGAGGTVSLARRIGRCRTGYLAITGTELDARAALAWGLVDRLEP